MIESIDRFEDWSLSFITILDHLMYDFFFFGHFIEFWMFKQQKFEKSWHTFVEVRFEIAHRVLVDHCKEEVPILKPIVDSVIHE